MRKRVLQTVLISGLIAAQVVLQFPTVVYAESGEEVQTEVANTSGATEGMSGADEGTSVSSEGTSGATEGTSGADEGTSGADEGTSGADEGTSGSTGASTEGSESNEVTGGTTAEGSESESSDSNEANTDESSESSEGTSGSVGENSGDTSDTSETGSTESAELTYKVTFKDSLDETFEVVVEVEENASAEAPEAPEHEGYAFVEWDADFSSVTEDMTVTAQYEEVVATPVLRSPLRSPAGGTSPAFNKTYGKITIEAEAGVIPDGAYFDFDVPSNVSELCDIMSSEKVPEGSRGVGDYSVRDIILYDASGNRIQPNGSVTISYQEEQIRDRTYYDHYTEAFVWYIDDSNNFTELECTYNGEEKVTFETDHFSIYGFAFTQPRFDVTFDTRDIIVVDPSTDWYYYDMNSETQDIYSYTYLKGTTNIPVPAAPARTKSVFRGWYKDILFTTLFDPSEPITSSFRLHAKWDKIYTVTFDSKGGLPVSSKNIVTGNVIDPWQTTTKAGFVFDGWYRDAGLTQPFTSTDVVTSDMTLYAKWKENTCTVTFDSKGGSPVSSSRVQKGATYMTMPANPTKADATFDGWYKDEDCTIPFDNSEAINSDMTLYAKWRQNTYSVTYVVPSYFNVTLNFDTPVTIVSGNNVISVNSGDLAYKPSNSAVLERGIVKDLASYMAFNPELLGLTVKEEPRVGYTDPHPGYTYILYGWYKDPAYTIPYDFTEPVTENITLYAKTDKIPLAFGTVIDFYFDYGYNETRQKEGRIDETGRRWYPDTSWDSSHIVKKKLYYAKWVEDPDPTQMVRIPSPFSSNAARGTEGVDSGYKMYFYTQASEQIAPEGYLASSQMYPGTVAVFFRYFFKDDSNPVPPVTPVQPSNPTPTPSDDPTPNPSEDPTPSVSPTPSVEPTETPSPTVSPSVSPAPSATPSPTVKPSAKPTQKPDSEDDEEDESGVLSSTHEVVDLVAEEVKEGSLTYVESNQFGFSRAYTLRYLNLDGKVKRVVNTKEI